MDFCNLCTRVFDRSDQRTMKFDDFIQCCVMLRSLTESFKTMDTNRSGVININYEQVNLRLNFSLKNVALSVYVDILYNLSRHLLLLILSLQFLEMAIDNGIR